MLSRYPFLNLSRPYLLSWGIPILVAVIFLPIFSHVNEQAKQNARRSSCQSSLKQIMLGVKQYIQDYDEKYPLLVVDASPKTPRQDALSGPIIGWPDAIQPYLKSTCILQCPSEMNTGSPKSYSEEGGYTDYWMNANLAGRKDSRTMLIMLGDGDGAKGNAHYAVSGLPANWQNAPDTKAWRGETQPPWFKRHMGGANYAFTDGHVKWLLPEQIETADGRFIP